MEHLPYTVSSESVSEGHPDKVCDYIADSVLDAYLAGTKLRWILDNVPDARRRAEAGELAFGSQRPIVSRTCQAPGTRMTMSARIPPRSPPRRRSAR